MLTEVENNKQTYKYDKNNNEIERIICNSEDRIEIKFIHYYDKKGYKIKTIEYDDPGEPNLLTDTNRNKLYMF